MNNTQACRVKANWSLVGEIFHKLPKYVYRVPITPMTKMVEHLGVIKERSDGRWDWWRFNSAEHKWKVGQGIADTKAWAQIEVLRGWDD